MVLLSTYVRKDQYTKIDAYRRNNKHALNTRSSIHRAALDHFFETYSKGDESLSEYRDKEQEGQ